MEKLSDYSNNVFSQFGEDGIIGKIFQIIGVNSKICIEFGAWDGFHLSNTANLWTNGWKGILIEGDREKFKLLVENVKQYNCHCINAYIGYEGENTIEKIFRKEKIFEGIDLLSIDIDGDDYYVLQSLTELWPRVIICEYNPTIPVNIELIPKKNNNFGCSALSLVKLAEKIGYKLVAMTETNCFFVSEGLYELFSEYELSLEKLAINKHIIYLMTGYDGKYILSQCPTYKRKYLQPTTQEFIGEYYRPPIKSQSNCRLSKRLRNIIRNLINWIVLRLKKK